MSKGSFRALRLFLPGAIFGLACALLVWSCGKEEEPPAGVQKSDTQSSSGPQQTSTGTSDATRLIDEAARAALEGRLDEAESAYRRAIDLAQSAPPRSAGVVERANAQNALGLLYFEQRKFDLAESLFRNAMDSWIAAGRADDPAAATVMNNLAGVCKLQGRYAEAESLYTRAIAAKEKSLSPDDPALARACNNLARLYEAGEKLAEAAPLYRRALAIWQKTLPPEHAILQAAQRSCTSIERRLREASFAPDEKKAHETHIVVATPQQESTAQTTALDDRASTPNLASSPANP